ncbi:MAG TPA: TetR/AcrR family transcriptional regulator [Oscillospiraceae bacterium]|nr:TetR/AcrR family transcriptional regulator [Oscillospiraceae bacterium]
MLQNTNICDSEVLSMNPSENPIAVQSKQWIIQSFLTLMQEKTFQEITISEIAERAQLVRKTFYRNFDSKEDVLQACFDSFVLEFIEELEKLPSITMHDALYRLFTLCEQHKAFFLALRKSRMLGFFLEQWNVALPHIHELMLNKIVDFPHTSTPKQLKYLLAFNVGGTWNILMNWIQEGMTETPAQLADMISEVASSALHQK